MKRKYRGYWTKENSHRAALKCKSRSEFKKKYGTAYRKARDNKWIDEICSHMKEIQKPSGYWTKERCVRMSICYETIKSLIEENSKLYAAIIRKGWGKECFKHMRRLGNKFYKIVYGYIFQKDKLIYVGITCNETERFLKHMLNENGKVFKTMIETDSYPKYVAFTDLIHYEEAGRLECEISSQYNSKGYITLNDRRFDGAQGSPIRKWSKENCHEVALKCDSKTEFRDNNPGAYCAAIVNKWIDEICSHMKEIKKPNGYWTKKGCKEVALKCDSKSEFFNRFSGAYHSAHKNGWLNEICSHMKEIQKVAGYWDEKKNCMVAASKCDSRFEFSRKFSRAYTVSSINDWLDEFFPKRKQAA